jgi:hypothetical protein
MVSRISYTYSRKKKMAGYSHRTAQPPILAVFLPWGDSAGAGRVRPAAAKVRFEC